MPRPNFFIFGAPKCGTTAMSHYLAQHPAVFMSDPKEPHFFMHDMPGLKLVDNEPGYMGLFDAATDATRIGEASVWYLISEAAARAVHEFDPEARIVVMLRDPVSLLHALHSQAVYSFYEDEPDFEKAWGLQEPRARGERVPRIAKEPAVLQYRRSGLLGQHMERLLSVFAREQVHVILFDDFKADPAGAYRRALDFLGLDDDGRTDFPAVNASKKRRLRWLNTWISRPPRALRRTLSGADRLLGAGRVTRLAKSLKRRVNHATTTPTRRDPLRPEFRRALEQQFRPDVERLSGILGRDLVSLWLDHKPAHPATPAPTHPMASPR